MALDWIKGALVALMVVYHAMGYSGFILESYRYLAFIRPSFVLITGFLLTNSYLQRYDVRDWRLHRRLAWRGLKLVLLYTVLNLALYFAQGGIRGSPFLGLEQFTANWWEIYFSPVGKTASFTILLSIGYLLFLAPVFLLLNSWSARSVPLIAACWVVLVCLLEWRDLSSDHVEMLGAGILGVAFGAMPRERIQGLASRWGVLIPLYLGYRIFTLVYREPYLLRLFGACLSLLILYGLALVLSPQSYLYRQVVLFGRYSLFGYLFQIAVVQVLARIPTGFSEGTTVGLMIVVALGVTWAATVLLDRLRALVHMIDSSYRMVFA